MTQEKSTPTSLSPPQKKPWKERYIEAAIIDIAFIERVSLYFYNIPQILAVSECITEWYLKRKNKHFFSFIS